MSNVSSWILICDPTVAESVNDALRSAERAESHYGEGFKEVGSHAGGPKWFEAEIYLAAFNYADDLVVAKTIESSAFTPEGWPETAQAWVMREEDDQFVDYKRVIQEREDAEAWDMDG